MLLRLRFVCAALLTLAAVPASAVVVYFADELGNVGSYDDASGIVSPVGDLTGFQVGQVVGIAWDPARQRILLLDRNAPQVYSMDPATGTAAPLFDPGFSFQGGAVVGNSLYGIDEGNQTVEAFDLTSFADLGLSAPPIVGHHHGMGVDGGQLYIGGFLEELLTARSSDGEATEGPAGNSHVATILPDGSFGADVVFFDYNVEDIDAYGGDFLLAGYSGDILRIDGTSGALTTFLDAAQVTAGGVADSVTGVAVATGGAVPIQAIPALGRWGLGGLTLALALAGAAVARRRRVERSPAA